MCTHKTLYKQKQLHTHTLISVINLFTVGRMRSGTAKQIAAMHLARLLKAWGRYTLRDTAYSYKEHQTKTHLSVDSKYRNSGCVNWLVDLFCQHLQYTRQVNAGGGGGDTKQYTLQYLYMLIMQ